MNWTYSLFWLLHFLWTWVSAKRSFDLSKSDLSHMEQKLYDDHNDDNKWENSISTLPNKVEKSRHHLTKSIGIQKDLSRLDYRLWSLKAKVTRSQKSVSGPFVVFSMTCHAFKIISYESESSGLNTVLIWVNVRGQRT